MGNPHPSPRDDQPLFDAACSTAPPATWSKAGEVIERWRDYQRRLGRQADS